MEIKLKENSNLIIKNHNGDTLCSIDEATGNIVGSGTKLYKHSVSLSSGENIIIISNRSSAYPTYPTLILTDYLKGFNILVVNDGTNVVNATALYCAIKSGKLNLLYFDIDRSNFSTLSIPTGFTDTVTEL